MFAITAVIITIVAAIGTGLAVTYTATTTSSNNMLSYSGDVVEVVKPDGDTLNNALSIIGPTVSIYENQAVVTGTQKMMDGYRIRIDTEKDNLVLRCWVILDDARSWVFIDSITLSVDGRQVGFIKDGESSIPSSAISLSPGLHPFTFTIKYKSITLDLYDNEETTGLDEDISFLDLSGARLVFAVGDSDPLPGVNGYEIISS